MARHMQSLSCWDLVTLKFDGVNGRVQEKLDLAGERI